MFLSIQILRKLRNVREIPVSVYCISMLQENAVRLWPENQYIPRNVGNCQLTRFITWKTAVWIVTAVRTSYLNKEKLYVHCLDFKLSPCSLCSSMYYTTLCTLLFFKFAIFNIKQRESRKRVVLNDLQQVRGLFVCLFVMCKCKQHNSFIQETVLK